MILEKSLFESALTYSRAQCLLSTPIKIVALVAKQKVSSTTDIDYEEKPIREDPPTIKELAVMLKTYNGQIKHLLTPLAKTIEVGLKDKLTNLNKRKLSITYKETGI